jgi:hypothetical protein
VSKSDQFQHQSLKIKLIQRFSEVWAVEPTEILLNEVFSSIITDCIGGKIIYIDTESKEMYGIEPCEIKNFGGASE